MNLMYIINYTHTRNKLLMGLADGLNITTPSYVIYMYLVCLLEGESQSRGTIPQTEEYFTYFTMTASYQGKENVQTQEETLTIHKCPFDLKLPP